MKRKVFQPKEPRVPLTAEDCIKLAEEADRYRESIQKRLDMLDYIPSELWFARVK